MHCHTHCILITDKSVVSCLGQCHSAVPVFCDEQCFCSDNIGHNWWYQNKPNARAPSADKWQYSNWILCAAVRLWSDLTNIPTFMWTKLYENTENTHRRDKHYRYGGGWSVGLISLPSYVRVYLKIRRVGLTWRTVSSHWEHFAGISDVLNFLLAT
jgi:hypothetical protein